MLKRSAASVACQFPYGTKGGRGAYDSSEEWKSYLDVGTIEVGLQGDEKDYLSQKENKAA